MGAIKINKPPKMMGSQKIIGVLVVLSFFIGGCFSKQHNPQLFDNITTPEHFVSKGASTRMPESKWWTEWGSEELNKIIETAFTENLELQAAWSRIEQAEAMIKQSNSGFWPTLDAQFSGGRQRTAGMRGAETNNSFSGSISAGYEIDIWGKTRAATHATELDALATRDNLDAIAMTMTAQIVEIWVDIIYQRAKRKLMYKQIETAEYLLELTLFRLKYGQATALDILQQEQIITTLGTVFPLIDGAEQVSQNRLSLLIGVPPRKILSDQEQLLPYLPPVFDVGIPADLLEQRPDVRASRRRAQAADARVVIAIANRLPSVRIAASLSLMATNPGDLLDEIFWNVIGSVMAPLFDGGRRSAEVERSKAFVNEQVLNYRQTLLVSMGDVESALILERQQLIYIENLKIQQTTSEEVLDTALEQFQRGVTGYSRVLMALTDLQNLEISLLDAQKQLLSYRIQLHRALGGTWTKELVSPVPQTKEKTKEKSETS